MGNGGGRGKSGEGGDLESKGVYFVEMVVEMEKGD